MVHDYDLTFFQIDQCVFVSMRCFAVVTFCLFFHSTGLALCLLPSVQSSDCKNKCSSHCRYWLFGFWILPQEHERWSVGSLVCLQNLLTVCTTSQIQGQFPIFWYVV